MVTANEPHRERCTTYNLTRGGAGSTDVLCSQSEQETVSRQWSFDSGIPDYIDHSAKVDMMLHFERLLSNNTGILYSQCGLPNRFLTLYGIHGP